MDRVMGAVIKCINARPVTLQQSVHMQVQTPYVLLCIITPGHAGLIGNHHQTVSRLL